MRKTRVITNTKHLAITMGIPFIMTIATYFQFFSPSANAGKQLLWLPIFMGFYFLVQSIRASEVSYINSENLSKRLNTVRYYSAGLASLFSFLLVIGREVQKYNGFSPYLADYVRDFLSVIGMFLIFYWLLKWAFLRIQKAIPFSNIDDNRTNNSLKSFFIFWALIFCVWFIYSLIFYPGLLTYDSVNQITQIENRQYTNHHPFIHTQLIALCYQIGKTLFHSANVGVYLYSFIQMTILSAICAYAVYFLKKKKVSAIYFILVLCFFAFTPIHGLYSVTMWKDILFGGFTLLLVLLLFDMSADPEFFFKSWRKKASLLGVLFLFCVFRNNGLYAALLFFPILIIVMKKYWKPVLLIGCSSFALVFIYLGPVLDAFHVKPALVVSSLSIPLQQFARTVKDHKESIPSDELAILNEILPVDALGSIYNPQLSDPVVNSLNYEVFKQNEKRYGLLWIKWLSHYPKSYIESFAANSYGYWYPSVHYIFYVYDSMENSLGITTSSHPRLARYVDKGISVTIAEIPLLSLLLSIGFTVWLLVLSAAIFAFRKQKRLMLPFALLAALWVTVIASPVFAEYRYVYGLVLSCPVCLVMSCLYKNSRPTAKAASSTCTETN